MYLDSEGEFHGSGDSYVWVRDYFSQYMSECAKLRKPITFLTKKGEASATAADYK